MALGRRSLVGGLLLVASVLPVAPARACAVRADLLVAPMGSSWVIDKVDRRGCGAAVVANGNERSLPGSLVTGPGLTAPSWLRVGRTYVYGWTYFAGDALVSEIRTGNVSGGRSTTILQVPAAGFVYDLAASPDGRRIAFTLLTWNYPVTAATWTALGSTSRIYVVNADGSGLLPVSTVNTSFDSEPVWSPDSRRIAFTSERGVATIVVSDLSPGSLGKAVSPLGLSSSRPQWSPDGKQVAFLANPLDTTLAYHLPELRTVRPDGLAPRRVLREADWESWAPDSRRLVVRRMSGLAVVNARTGSVRSLAGTERSYFPAWSRDGRQIAFALAADPDYLSGLYAVGPDGHGMRRLTESNDYGYPVWGR